MPANRQPSGFCRPRNWRGLLSVLIAVVYLLAGALHGLHDIDVTTPGGGSEIASIVEDGSAAGHGDHKALGGHHCHGCFSVAVAQPMLAAAAADIVAAPIAQREPALIGVAPDTDSPPPKHLT
ncbi:hypothetical protein [Bradyrhizobium sp. Arg816]|uniref:hypothetical protein n=1 Tax=Bradyrhizobium sp. Arg816 TaxID=2998491 RepID=UPI00249F0E67|nr:hypothetical protein [Bradyrhizobium sp. Arg816]MDI3564877.1 hypothetical protein [Bradyrhizobium sp. Arg816]